jgi:hypothetical protein
MGKVRGGFKPDFGFWIADFGLKTGTKADQGTGET